MRARVRVRPRARAGSAPGSVRVLEVGRGVRGVWLRGMRRNIKAP